MYIGYMHLIIKDTIKAIYNATYGRFYAYELQP